MKRIITLFTFALATSVFAGGVQAGGILYWAETNGGDMSTAAAGIAARAQDAATVLTNPAGMILLEGNTEFSASAGFIYMNLPYDADDSLTTVAGRNGNSNQVLPLASAFYARKINPDLSWGISFANYFGLGLDWSSGWKGRYYADEVTLIAPSLQPSIAYRVNDKISVGGGLTVNIGSIDYKSKLNNPGSPDDGSMKYKDTDLAYGANLGIMFELSEHTRIGVQYLSKVEYNFKDKLTLRDLGPLHDAAATATGLRDTNIEIGINQPQTLVVSGFHQLDDKWAVMGTLNFQDWSEFSQVEIRAAGPVLNANVVVRAPMQDIWGLAVGTQYQYSPKWQINGGLAFDSKVNEGPDVLLTLPISSVWLLGLGATYAPRDNLSVTGAFELLWYGDMSTDSGAASAASLSGRVTGDYNDAALAFFRLEANWQFE